MQTTSTKIIHICNTINSIILDILFPIHCIYCKKEGFWLCQVCLEKIPLRDDHVCPVCEKMTTPDGKTCLSCKRKSSLDGLLSATFYKNSFISKAVHLYKCRFVSDLHNSLGELLVRAMRKTEIPIPDVIIPIPLHKRRLRWRGFSQSSLLAKYIATNLIPQMELPFNENTLVRNRYTLPQMGIRDHRNRKQNIAGAFSIPAKQALKGKTVLLVDDVATTGSTIFECAKVLKKSGAKAVYAIVIARQETANI